MTEETREDELNMITIYINAEGQEVESKADAVEALTVWSDKEGNTIKEAHSILWEGLAQKLKQQEEAAQKRTD